jgi:hypothetical protein
MKEMGFVAPESVVCAAGTPDYQAVLEFLKAKLSTGPGQAQGPVKGQKLLDVLETEAAYVSVMTHITGTSAAGLK